MKDVKPVIRVEWPDSPIPFNVVDGIAYDYAKIRVMFSGVEDYWNYMMTVSFEDADYRDSCIFIRDKLRLELHGFNRWGNTEAYIYAIPLRPGKHELRFKVCIYGAPYTGTIEYCEEFSNVLEFYKTGEEKKHKSKRKHKSTRTDRENQPPTKHELTIYVDNCASAGGGTIYIRDRDTWVPLTAWGLSYHKKCCEPVKIVLPSGRYLVRANCGPYKWITLPGDKEVHLVAVGCYGSTDDINAYKRYGLGMVVVDGNRRLFGIDEHDYEYTTPTTLFLEPGEHVLYTSDGRAIKIYVRRGQEIHVSL